MLQACLVLDDCYQYGRICLLRPASQISRTVMRKMLSAVNNNGNCEIYQQCVPHKFMLFHADGPYILQFDTRKDYVCLYCVRGKRFGGKNI